MSRRARLERLERVTLGTGEPLVLRVIGCRDEPPATLYRSGGVEVRSLPLEEMREREQGGHDG